MLLSSLFLISVLVVSTLEATEIFNILSPQNNSSSYANETVVVSDLSTNSTSTSSAISTSTTQTSHISLNSRSLLSKNDEYIASNKKRCQDTRNLVACIKYKAAKVIWLMATNGLGYFPNELSREMRQDTRRIRLIQLSEPSEIVVFGDAKSFQDDSEWTQLIKFLKRAFEVFGRNHGLQISLPGSSGLHIATNSNVEMPRGRLHEKKKRKWLIILPLIILMKIAHLKMTMVTLFLAVLGLNVLLVGGVGWLIHYLKFKTLCKIHPQLVQTHSHVYDSDPAEYSSFVGSSFPGSYYSSSGSSPHEVGFNGYSKDWASSKAYSGHNHLDTISKRINHIA